jgi:2-hydroxychromene-2-carboxylate isomerase
MTVRRLRAAVPSAFAELDWTPYWDPDEQTSAALTQRGGEFHYVQMSRAKHLYILMDTKRLSQAEGVAMAWPIDVDPFWELPHLGWLLARRLGRAEQFYDEVIAARWERGHNICDLDVLRGCADRAGLDADAVITAHKDPDIRDEGAACLNQAYLDDVFGVPYFKWSRHRFWGLDRLDAFLATWQPTQQPAAPQGGPVVEAGGPTTSYDTDTTGGCG